jgi:hypothetical protein
MKAGVAIERPLPGAAGLNAYAYGAARAETLARHRAEQAASARQRELAAIDRTYETAVDLALVSLREDAALRDRLFWGRVRLIRHAAASFGSPEAVEAALLAELELHAADLAARPYRREVALAVLDERWVSGRRAYLEQAA